MYSRIGGNGFLQNWQFSEVYNLYVLVMDHQSRRTRNPDMNEEGRWQKKTKNKLGHDRHTNNKSGSAQCNSTRARNERRTDSGNRSADSGEWLINELLDGCFARIGHGPDSIDLAAVLFMVSALG